MNCALGRLLCRSRRLYSDGREFSSLKEWEKLAEKELSRAENLSVDSLRTNRITPEGIAIQPVYYETNSDNPEMPGIFPYTRGPYATMYVSDRVCHMYHHH